LSVLPQTEAMKSMHFPFPPLEAGLFQLFVYYLYVQEIYFFNKKNFVYN